MGNYMRRPECGIAIAAACAVLAGCSSTPVDSAPPVVRIKEAAKPSVSRPLNQVLPTSAELTTTMGVGPGFTGQLVVGGADMLLQGVGEADATPAECVSAGYRLQKVVYAASPVREVASQSWAGGDLNGPPLSGFFGAVRFATADDAKGFFAASADKWSRCNGQTLVLHQPEHGADGVSRITDVVVEPTVVSAAVLHDDGSTIQRALGVASDCVVDVEVTGVDRGGGARGAVDIANLMLQKIGVG
jgi:PknH-like extracellular domain